MSGSRHLSHLLITTCAALTLCLAPAAADPFTDCNCTITPAGPEITVCQDTPQAASVPDNGVDFTYSWSVVSGPIIIDSGADSPTVNYHGTGGGTAILQITISRASPFCSCTNQLTVHVVAAPTADAGADQTICSTDSVSLSGSSTNSTGCTWSTGGDGSFDDDTSLTATYTPGANDLTNGTVTLTLTCTGNAPCDEASDDMVVTIVAAPTADAGPDQTICSNQSATMAGSSTNSTGCTWSTAGDGSFDDASAANAVYTPGAADIAAGSVVLTYTCSGNAPCADASDDMTLTIVAAPTADAGPDQTICSNQSATMAGDSSNSTGCTWSTAGDGSFDDASAANAVYTPGNADIAAGSVVLTYTCSGNAPCADASDDMTLTIMAAPTADAGSDQTICSNQSATMAGDSSNSTGCTWSTAGDGSFDDASAANAVYTPGAADIAAGSVVLTYTCSGNAPCADASDDMTLTIVAAPTADAGSDQTICSNQSATMAGSSTNSTACTWSTAGDGSFDDASAANAVYTPGAADIAAGSVVLTYTCSGNTPCADASDDMTLTIVAAPTADAGPDQHVCANESVQLAGSTSNSSGCTWTTDGDGTFDDDTSLSAVYTPGSGDLTNGSVTLTLTCDGNAPCSNDSDSMTVTFEPAPSADAGADQTICSDETVSLSASSTNTGSCLWTTSGDGTFDDDTSQNAVYTPGDGDIAAGTVDLTYTCAGNDPCDEASDTMTVTILEQPSAEITPDSTTISCTGWVYTASVPNAGGGATYSWSVTAGATIVSGTEDDRIVRFTADGSESSFTLSVTVNAGNGCSNSNSIVITVDGSPSGTLELRVEPPGQCYHQDDLITVEILMLDLSCPAAGFQAFIEYDSTNLAYVAGSYTSSPFNLPAISINTTVGSLNHPALGQINLASGVNTLVPFTLAQGTHLLATLTFQALATAETCGDSDTDRVRFRTNNPPSRFTDLLGVGLQEAPGPGQVTPYILGLVLEDSERIRIDDAGPVMVCPDPVTVECAADIPEPATTVAEFEALDGSPSIDDCSDDADIILTHVDDPADPEECFQGVLTRTYYAEDECGNVSSCVQYITVEDTLPPTISCPPDISVNTDPDECQATIADIGGDFLLLPDEWELFYQAELVAGGLELRSLAAETPPYGAAVWTPSSPMTFADLDTLSAEFEMQTGCFVGGSPRFGVGVDCDNDGFTDGYVFIYFGTPPNYTDCPPLNTPQSTGNLIGLAGNVYDTGQVGGTFYDSYANALALVGTCDVTRIVMALDASWNQDQQMLVTSVDVNDDTYNFASSAASDNCGIQSVVGVRSDALPLTDPYPLGVTTITWTVTDCAGATDECVQTITVTDAQAPDLTCPENTTIECDESDDPGNTGNATATDNCDVPTVSYTTMYQAALPNFATLASPAGWGFYTQNTASGAPVMGPDSPPLGVGSFHMPTGSGTGGGLGGKTFLLTGNHDGTRLADITAFSYSTYVSTSSLAATHLAPAINLYIDLDDDGDRDTTLVFEPVYVVAEQGAVAQGVWQTWDTLDGPGWWYTSSGGYAGLLPSPGGEFKPLSHYIGLFPDARIVAWFAPGMNFVTGQSSGGIWAGFDGNVDNVTFETNAPSSVTYDFEPTTVSIICNGTITRTWTATDASSNTSTCTQTITVVDTTPPDLTIPADATVDCGESPDPWNTGEATADDNCGTVTVSYSDDRSGLVGCNSNGCDATGVILRTWTAADQCGNQTSQMQTITVIDTAGPIMHDCPEDITVLPIAGECSAVVTYAEPTATDECYFQGWEEEDYEAGAAITTPSVDWNRYQSLIERVPSGTDGITSMTGSGHGRITALPVPPPPNDWTGAFTRLGGYTNCFGEGFSTRLDIYLDVDDPAVAADTYGWDLSCAANTPAGGHRRDFIFHASGKLGAAYNRILIAGSNNSNFTRRNDLASINHHEVTTSGWYTFEWVFRDFGDGTLAVDLNLRDSSDTLLFTETRHDASDIIGTNVGGNRYMWFTFLEVDTLAIDNTRMIRNVAVSCSPPSGSVFPAGTTTVTCTAVDSCGNESSCSFDVTVDTVMLDVTVELSPTIAPAGTLTRCITFEAWDCTDSQNPIMETVSVPMTFTVDPPNPTLSSTVTICLPAHEYSCITARDRLHTLRSTQTVFTPIGPQHYAVDFTGARSDESPPGVGHRLVGGNLNDDPFIDILDYGIWAGQVFTSFGDGDTDCDTTGPHADISGDGSVGFGDFTFIFVNFLKEHEANCCGQPGFAPFTDGPARRQRPLTRISVAELRRRGMHDAIAGDVNRDGWLDTWDIVLVLLGERPRPLGTPPAPVGRPPVPNGADGP